MRFLFARFLDFKLCGKDFNFFKKYNLLIHGPLFFGYLKKISKKSYYLKKRNLYVLRSHYIM